MNRDIVINNIDKVTFERLKFEADKQGTDLKTLIIYLIKRSLGLEKITDKNINYNDLDHLAGTWSTDEYSDFKLNTSGFNKIDEDIKTTFRRH